MVIRHFTPVRLQKFEDYMAVIGQTLKDTTPMIRTVKVLRLESLDVVVKTSEK